MGCLGSVGSKCTSHGQVPFLLGQDQPNPYTSLRFQGILPSSLSHSPSLAMLSNWWALSTSPLYGFSKTEGRGYRSFLCPLSSIIA